MNESNTIYVAYLRVSTAQQGESRLGLEAQLEDCRRFAASQGGVISKVFQDIESGKNRERPGLWEAIGFCQDTGAHLVIAKLDRLARDVEFTFKVINTKINIHFADMPIVNTVMLGVIASVAQYERELTSKRTTAALAAKRARGELMGGSDGEWGKNSPDADRSAVLRKARNAHSVSRRTLALKHPANVAFRDFMEDWQAIHGEIGWQADWGAVSDKLKARNLRTPKGLEFTPERARAMFIKITNLYKNS